MKMWCLDTRSEGGKEWFSFSVVVVLTAPHPGGADKNTRSKVEADCISGPGIKAVFGWVWWGLVSGHI